jgi:site-specific DNA recombinase
MTTKQPRTTVAYARLSLDRTEGQSIQAQLKDCHELANRLGLVVSAEYVDESITADGRARRPQYDAMMQAVTAGTVGAVLCVSWERLWRGRKQRAEAVDVMQAQGVALHSVRSGSADWSTATGKLIWGILSEIASHEWDVISERQRRAVLRRVENGDPPSGPRAYGYDPTGWGLVDGEAEHVPGIFEAWCAGATLSGLAADLTRQGVMNTQGEPFSHNGIRWLLSNPRYAALRRYEGRLHPGKWPALVEESVWHAAQARLNEDGRATSPGPARAHLLSGIARHGRNGDGNHCGLPVSSGSRGKGQLLVQCSTGPHGKHMARACGPVVGYVVDVLVERLGAADVSALLAADEQGDELAEARRQAVALRAKLDRLAAVFADSDEPDDVLAYRDARRATQAKLADVEAKMAATTRTHVLAPFATDRDPRTVWDGLTLDRQRAVLDCLLDVTVHSAARASKHRFDPATVDVHWKGGPVVVTSADAVTFDGLADQDARDLAAAVREAGWDAVRRGGCVTVPAQAVPAAQAVRDDLERWSLTYPMDSGLAVREAVAAVVGQAPALTAAQRDALGALLG